MQIILQKREIKRFFRNTLSPQVVGKLRRRLNYPKQRERIVVPEWLDFEPCRTRYIESLKAYTKLCNR
ncbi:MAG TPA: hypothetical protein PK802_02515 [Candidatus Cloacimonadota bacterium]|jgi:hypothetical protein|nr:hypothetical protein [Candidatus Cloacimonadota bacterium]HOF59261.1 hypothetical protein [Candidatus Cloacimonadota bacterium]HOR58420.1 hypothetical protein [Candidatus Cloacimonadota bacterium]HPB08547.1 hypothetical protein [Candidatus Cloacimonadota bacterium]HQL13130.1 hypothetical protein [Candidatus Cloacimonadota bacterium]